MLSVSLDTHLNTFRLAISFSAQAGKTTVLLGESGAGKSTVLRLLAGLLRPEQGHISFNDVTYFDSERNIFIPPQERPFGYVFQDYTLFPHLSVFENVAFGLRAQHLSSSLIKHRVGEALAQVRLEGLDGRKPAQLSGGQQQRVAIARALALHPDILLLDEPLSALDVQTRREVRQELRHILSTINVTTVMVTHQYLEALLFGQHILVLDHGQILQQGNQRDLLEHPRSAYVAELAGVNFFRGRIVRYESHTICIVEVRMGMRMFELAATLKDSVVSDAPNPTIGEEASVVISPHSITLHQRVPDSSARNVLQGEVAQIVSLGMSGINGSDGTVRVSITLDKNQPLLIPLTAEITQASASAMALSEGKSVYATFKATEAWAYL